MPRRSSGSGSTRARRMAASSSSGKRNASQPARARRWRLVDHVFHEWLTPEKLDKILGRLEINHGRVRRQVEPGVVRVDETRQSPGTLETYRKIGGYDIWEKYLRGETDPRVDHRRGEGLGAARPRRRGVSHRHEVELHARNSPIQSSTSCATRTRASPAPATIATFCATTRMR